MPLREDVTSILAITSGALVSVGLTAALLLREPAAPQIRQTVPILVAARNLNAGTTLTRADVKVVEWPGDAAPAGFASSPGQVVGLVVRVPMSMNEPFLRSKLTREGIGEVTRMLIPEGMRAVAVQVNDVVAVAGWVKPGTRVDVMVRNDVEPVARVVLQNVTVLGNERGISQQENGNARAIAVVTLMVTRPDAERVAMAAIQGQIHLAVREPMDLGTVRTPIRQSGLLRRVTPR